MITAAALLVLVALGLFVWGIAAGSTALYWACVAVSAVAAVLLVVAFLGMRRAVTAVGTQGVPSPRREQEPAGAPEREPAAGREPAAAREPGPATRVLPDPAPADDPAPLPRSTGAHAAARQGDTGHGADYAEGGPGSFVWSTADGAHAGPTSPPSPAAAPVEQPAGAVADVPPVADGAEDPPVEEVEVTDLLLVVDLHDDVHVLDEHPRYHLDSCPWLAGRSTIPLPVDEARTDGFTPCGVCAPDHGLAERERSRRAARGGA